jgi:hypothetical protein
MRLKESSHDLQVRTPSGHLTAGALLVWSGPLVMSLDHEGGLRRQTLSAFPLRKRRRLRLRGGSEKGQRDEMGPRKP